MNIFQTPLFAWSIALIIGIPLSIIVLSEIIDRLQRRAHPLTSAMQLIRNLLLPFMTLFLVLRYVIAFSDRGLPMRLVATIFWALAIVAIFRFSRGLFAKRDDEPTWHDDIPNLFLSLPAYILMLLIASHLIQNIWGQPLGELATVFGVGSLVIALALQDTLSNLVSGLLLLINRPFKSGEFVEIGDEQGHVIDVNWRYTSLKTRPGNLIVIPNGSIANESIKNYYRPNKPTRIVESIDVAYVHPPNKVKRMLMETMLKTPGILHDPAPSVLVSKIGNPMMGYQVRYWINDFVKKSTINSALMTRIWYASQRHNVPFPSPAHDVYHYDGPTTNKESEITAETLTAMLRGLDTFEMLPNEAIEPLGEAAQLKHYAQSELIIGLEEEEPGFMIVASGIVRLTIPDHTGTERLIKRLDQGDFFGESGLFGRAISPLNAVADDDAELLLIDHAAMNHIINRHPQFSTELNAIITQRRLAMQRIVGTNDPDPNQPHQLNGNHQGGTR